MRSEQVRVTGVSSAHQSVITLCIKETKSDAPLKTAAAHQKESLGPVCVSVFLRLSSVATL